MTEPPHDPATPPRRAGGVPRLLSALLLVGLALVGCTPEPPPEPQGTPRLVGTGPEPEQRLLATVAAGLLARAGERVEVVVLADAASARQALELGDVDVLPAYTGEAWLDVLGRSDPPADPATSLARVRERDAESGLSWLSPPISPGGGVDAPPADATFALVVAGDGPTTLSGLARRLVAAPATLCVDPRFAERPDGLGAVLDAAGVEADAVDVLGVPPSDAVAGVAAGACLAGLTTATDGEAWLVGLRPVVDDLGVFPAFVVTLVVRDAVFDDLPTAAEVLAPLVSTLTTARLGGWNARVVAGEPVEDVAADVVTELVGPPPEG